MKKDWRNESENELQVIAVNSKIRLTIFVIFTWGVGTLFPVALPLTTVFLLRANAGLVVTLAVSLSLLLCFFILLGCSQFFIMHAGIKYRPKDLINFYREKNQPLLHQIDGLKVGHVIQFFNVPPVYSEIYGRKKQKLHVRPPKEFTKLSWIEAANNRLVVNGQIDKCIFSFGVVTKLQKNHWKIFFLAIGYYGPLIGPFIGFFPKMIVNEDPDKVIGSKWEKQMRGANSLLQMAAAFSGSMVHPASANWPPLTFKYHKFGGMDLFPTKVGKKYTENYLIFSAQLPTPIAKPIILMPLVQTAELGVGEVYQWPENLSVDQTTSLKALIQSLGFYPNIYVYSNNISIVLKKYHVNEQDNQQLQTWELLKDSQANSERQFHYLQQAVQIYRIFSEGVQLNGAEE